jgi:peptide/nickel transport system ATP-binding protein
MTTEIGGTPAPREKLLMAPVILDVAGLSVDFLLKGGPPSQAVVDVSFSLREGEVLGLVGESGCGKTTLVLALLRLLPANGRIVDGTVLLNGVDLLSLTEREMNTRRWREMSFIFQGAMNALNPVRRVGDQIAEALRSLEEMTSKKTIDNRVAELLDLVGIGPERRNQYPHQYSGGMRQRAMIAMALACKPQIIIADEPTTALDVMVQAQILELLERLRDAFGLSVIIVTHDLGVVAEMCDSVLVMYGGVMAEYADVDTIYNSPQHPYTRELLRAFPDISRPAERLSSIPGSPPRLSALPPGCRFAPRCPEASETCHILQPGRHMVKDNHLVSCHLVDPLGMPSLSNDRRK